MTTEFPQKLVDRVFGKCTNVKMVNGTMVSASDQSIGSIVVLYRVEKSEFPFRVVTMVGDDAIEEKRYSLPPETNQATWPIEREIISYQHNSTMINGVAVITCAYDEQGKQVRHTGTTLDFNPQEVPYDVAIYMARIKARDVAEGKIAQSAFINERRIIAPSQLRKLYTTAIAASNAYVKGLPIDQRAAFKADRAIV